MYVNQDVGQECAAAQTHRFPVLLWNPDSKICGFFSFLFFLNMNLRDQLAGWLQ